MNTSVRVPPSVFTLMMEASDLDVLWYLKAQFNSQKHPCSDNFSINLNSVGHRWHQIYGFQSFSPMSYRRRSRAWQREIWNLIWLLKLNDSQISHLPALSLDFCEVISSLKWWFWNFSCLSLSCGPREDARTWNMVHLGEWRGSSGKKYHEEVHSWSPQK